MVRTKKLVILVLTVPLILAGLGAGGYKLYESMDALHQENSKDLERFGYEMIGTNTSSETVGILGAKQLPTTFDEGPKTPTQKVIRGLIRDKDALLFENKELQDHIEQLKSQITELTEYKQLNEHFAPEKLKDELRSVENQLKAFLIRNPDAERFSTLQIEIMSAAGAAEYKAYITRNRLMLSEDKKQNIINNYLPAYAFCVGDGVDVAANTRSEERILANFFRTEDTSLVSEVLFQDLSSVLTPCQLSIREKMDNDKV